MFDHEQPMFGENLHAIVFENERVANRQRYLLAHNSGYTGSHRRLFALTSSLANCRCTSRGLVESVIQNTIPERKNETRQQMPRS